MTDSEIGGMKIKDLFEVDQILTGRTEIETKTTVSVGTVLSIPYNEFVTQNEDDDASYAADGTGHLVLNGAGIAVSCPVSLPQGAIVTSCIVYSNVTTENWTLVRNPVTDSGGAETLATAALGTTDTSISFATINNVDFRYHIYLDAMDASDRILGAVIVFTV